MRTRPRRTERRRRGAVLAEAAVVLSTFLMLLIGAMEYCRYVMLRNLTDHAAREGARYAVVHTYDQTTAQVQAVAKSQLAGQDAQLTGLSLSVFKCNPTTGASTGLWTDAQFGDTIMMQVTGTYRPAVAGFLKMSGTIPIKAQSMMRCEAN